MIVIHQNGEQNGTYKPEYLTVSTDLKYGVLADLPQYIGKCPEDVINRIVALQWCPGKEQAQFNYRALLTDDILTGLQEIDRLETIPDVISHANALKQRRIHPMDATKIPLSKYIEPDEFLASFTWLSRATVHRFPEKFMNKFLPHQPSAN